MKPRYTVLTLLICSVLVLFSGNLAGQQTTGEIRGTITDSSGAVLPGVSVSITERASGRVISAVTNESGLFVVRSLPAGEYQVSSELDGFKTMIREVTVNVGQTTTTTFTMEVGEITEVVTVAAQSIKVNSSTNTVQGTVTAATIQELPLNGRNFLDLAQTQPGAQLVDGGDFDPTKNGMTGISLGARSGRVTRITVDGIDISDETVGTTLANISPDAMQEFQLQQSSLDPSTSIGSSGAVNIVTKSGTNEVHGSGFFIFRDEELDALPASRTGDPVTDAQLEGAEFDREHVGFDVGGPIVRDKLFFFLNWEKVNQDGTTFTQPSNFPNFVQPVSTPFNDNLGLGRLDWVINDSTKFFGRFNHETQDLATGFGGNRVCCAPFVKRDVTNVAAFGIDVATPSLTHSARYGFTDFNDQILTNNLGLPEFEASNGIPVSIALNGRVAFFSGPNRLAPQSTLQTNHQWKYDGAWVVGNHTFRYGTEVNWIKDNVFASFFGVGPEARGTLNNSVREEIIARGGDPLDPLEFPFDFAFIGNGQGSFSEIANNGQPLGGINNTRFAWYASDTWKVFQNLTLNFGVRYELDTGQVNDDLPLPTDPGLIAVLGRKGIQPTRLDQNNFGPQFGFAWQPFGTGDTVIRGGAGIFYETQVFNNSLFDRTNRLAEGLGFAITTPPLPGNIDSEGRVTVQGVPVNNIDFRALSGQPLKDVLDELGQTQADFQAAFAQVQFDPNGTPLIAAAGTTDAAGPIFVQDFSSPYGFQHNIGIQQQLGDSFVLQADIVRNRGVHNNLVRDFNRTRAANNFDAEGARAQVAEVLAEEGFASIDEAIGAGFDFTGFGLSSFFSGDDPSIGTIDVIMTSGRSTYTAAQVQLTGRFSNPFGFEGVKNLFMNISYAGSRFNSVGGGNTNGDQDFLPQTAFDDDFLQVRASGPSGLDRTHNLSAQFYLDVPWGLHLNVNHRWATARAETLFLTTAAGGNEEIFFTDLDGDGTTNDLLPGTGKGAFGRSVQGGDELNEVLNRFNNEVAGTLTPAAQQLVLNGIMTLDQLQNGFGVGVPSIPLAPQGQVENDSFIVTDFRISKSIYLADESVEIVPMFEVFNLFNVANYDRLTGELDGTAGSVNGTVQGNRTNRIGGGSGVFSQGIPRSLQFGIRVKF